MDLSVSPEELEGVVQALREDVAQLQGKIAVYEAHGLNLLQGGTLQGHPIITAATVPDSTVLTANGMSRAVLTGGNYYVYQRFSDGAIKRAQFT